MTNTTMLWACLRLTNQEKLTGIIGLEVYLFKVLQTFYSWAIGFNISDMYICQGSIILNPNLKLFW